MSGPTTWGTLGSHPTGEDPATMADANQPAPFQSDYTEVIKRGDHPGWVVIAYGPQLGRMTALETTDVAEANTFAARLSGLMASWHRTSPS